MASYEFQTVDVFTESRFGGNPLAVLPDARGLETDQMQRIANEFNLAETTFVLPPTDSKHDAHVRIFTPASEMPFAGHPNVGTAYVLARKRGLVSGGMTFEEGAGLVRVGLIAGEDKRVTGARIEAPRSLTVGEAISVETVAACGHLDLDDIDRLAHDPRVADVGLGFVLVRLTNRAALARATPDATNLKAALLRYPSLGGRFQIHYYVPDADQPGLIYCRMFAPLLGVSEDPATGSANAALAAFLVYNDRPVGGRAAYDIHQGVEMGRPSRIKAEAWQLAGGVIRASVAGSCVPVSQGTIEV